MIIPELDRLPWKPTSTSTLDHDADVLAYYDMPLSGVLGDGGSRYLFYTVTNPDAPERWAYVDIGACELDLMSMLADATGFDQVCTIVDQLTADQVVVVANCTPDLAITGHDVYPTFRDAANDTNKLDASQLH